MQKYVVLDLRQIVDALGAHYDPTLRDEYEGVCEACGEAVPQDVKECPICGVPVVWRNSPVWENRYGSPKAYIRLLTTVEPEDGTGKALCREAGVPGFANQTEADRWRRAAKKLGQQRMLGVVRYVVKDRKRRGRGAMAHALNLAEKIVREEEDSLTATTAADGAFEHPDKPPPDLLF